jgi:metal-sulfur cluster biosynthetic enzyme
LNPAWKPEMMTDDAKEKLGFYPTPASSESLENSEWE